MNNWKSFSFYMPNALPEIVRLQRQVFDVLQEPLNQVEDVCSHGEFLTRTIREYVTKVDAVVFFDLDCIPMKPGVVRRAVDIAVQNQMVIGCAQQANHKIEAEAYSRMIERRRTWPIAIRKLDSARIRITRYFGISPVRLDDPLIYAGPCFLVVPCKVYTLVGQPTLNVTSRCDAAGELTIACRNNGIKVKCLQPTFCHQPKFKLGETKWFGLGTIYGHCIFHAFETTYLSNAQSASLFRSTCKEVIEKYTYNKDHPI